MFSRNEVLAGQFSPFRAVPLVPKRAENKSPLVIGRAFSCGNSLPIPDMSTLTVLRSVSKLQHHGFDENWARCNRAV